MFFFWISCLSTLIWSCFFLNKVFLILMIKTMYNRSNKNLSVYLGLCVVFRDGNPPPPLKWPLYLLFCPLLLCRSQNGAGWHSRYLHRGVFLGLFGRIQPCLTIDLLRTLDYPRILGYPWCFKHLHTGPSLQDFQWSPHWNGQSVTQPQPAPVHHLSQRNQTKCKWKSWAPRFKARANFPTSCSSAASKLLGPCIAACFRGASPNHILKIFIFFPGLMCDGGDIL